MESSSNTPQLTAEPLSHVDSGGYLQLPRSSIGSTNSASATSLNNFQSYLGTIVESQHLSHQRPSRDSRSASTQSLVQHTSHDGEAQRRLLLIWIHGYMGSEVSFKSFPAHVHNAVMRNLQDQGKRSHIVHTKIYPRYESRYHIQAARDTFSSWLAPHEGPHTDVVLLGHSIGGIIAGEVALKPATGGSGRPRFHQLIGTVNFDTPFLGLHPRIIPTGIASLFRPKSKPAAPQRSASETGVQQTGNPGEATPTSKVSNQSRPYLPSNSSTSSSDLFGSVTSAPLSQSSSLSLPIDDPNYNPPYENDVRKPLRNGLASAWHFINKHSDDLFNATVHRLDSQMQFAACVADQTTLKERYAALKALDDASRRNMPGARFVNYYSACTGPPKTQKPPSPQHNGHLSSRLNGGTSNSFDRSDSLSVPASSVPTPLESPRISIEPAGYSNTDSVHEAADIEDPFLALANSQPDDSTTSEPEARSNSVLSEQPTPSTAIPAKATVPPPLPLRSPPPLPFRSPPPIPAPAHSLATADLPPIEPPSAAPDPFDPTLYPDKSTRKLLEKEHARQMKAHERALKDYDRAVKSRQKFLEKQEAAQQKQLDKQLSSEKSRQARATAAATNDPSTKCQLWEEKKQRKQKEKSASQPISAAKDDDGDDGDDDDDAPAPSNTKKVKDRKFCALPPKFADGSRDPCWVRLFMPNMDEVEAHCSLFDMDNDDNDNDHDPSVSFPPPPPPPSASFPDLSATVSEEGRGSLPSAGLGQQAQGRYVWFVGDVAERIVSWIP